MLLSHWKIKNIEKIFTVPSRPTLYNLNPEKEELKKFNKYINSHNTKSLNTIATSRKGLSLPHIKSISKESNNHSNDFNLKKNSTINYYSLDDYDYSLYFPQRREIIIENPEEIIQSGCLKGSMKKNISIQPEIDENNGENNGENNDLNNNENINASKPAQNIYDDLNEEIGQKFGNIQNQMVQNYQQNQGSIQPKLTEIGDSISHNMEQKINENQDNQEKIIETINLEESNPVNLDTKDSEKVEVLEKNKDESPVEVLEKNKDENPVEEIQETQNKKYPISSNNNSVVVVPPNYSTDDEDEFNAVTTLNQDLSSWKQYTDKEEIKLFFKPYPVKDEKGNDAESVIGFMDAKLNCPASKVIEKLNDFNFRQKVDSQYEKGKLISEKMEGNIKIMEIYLYMKMPFIFSDRDFVVEKKCWLDYNGNKDHALFFLHSKENSQFPEKDKPVRGKYINRSGYVKPSGDNKCNLYICTCMDIKMSLGVSRMSKSGAEMQEKWFKNLSKELAK